MMPKGFVQLLGACTDQRVCLLESPPGLCLMSQLLLPRLGRPLPLLRAGRLPGHVSAVPAALCCVDPVNTVCAGVGCAPSAHVQCDGGAAAQGANLGLVQPPPICTWSSTCMLSTAQSP